MCKKFNKIFYLFFNYIVHTFTSMITAKQKRIQDRRAVVKKEAEQLGSNDSKSALVKKLASRFNVTEVTIWNDIKQTS